MITFVVPGPPVPWARARRAGNSYFVDAKTAAHKQKIAHAARKAGVEKIEKPGVVEVALHFFFPRPKRGKYRYPIDKNDVDNLAKSALDALNGIAWDDDGQVCALVVRKGYAIESAEARTDIRIHRIA